jgi:DNA modification methylase
MNTATANSFSLKHLSSLSTAAHAQRDQRRRRRRRPLLITTTTTKSATTVLDTNIEEEAEYCSPLPSYLEKSKEKCSARELWKEEKEGSEVLADELLRVMRIQWRHGFTHVPSGYRKVTHGFGEILAGMQPAAADLAIDLLELEKGMSVLDPFVGGGTVCVCAMTKNLRAFGVDVSPLALHVCAHRVYVAEDVLQFDSFMRGRVLRVRELLLSSNSSSEDSNSSSLNNSFGSVAKALENAILEVQDLSSSIQTTALYFCLAEAERRHQIRLKRNKRKKKFGKRRTNNKNEKKEDDDDAYYSPLNFYERCVDEYISRIKDLHDAVDGDSSLASIKRGDARFDMLVADEDKMGKIDGILTSPPYPGVYDYVSFARRQRSRLRVGSTINNNNNSDYYINAKVPENVTDEEGNRQLWDENFNSAHEFGSKRELRKDYSGFAESWSIAQTQWLQNVYRTVRPNARIIIMIGDGANINSLESTKLSARESGFEFLASCSLSIVNEIEGADGEVRLYNAARKEHLILFQKPTAVT